MDRQLWHNCGSSRGDPRRPALPPERASAPAYCVSSRSRLPPMGGTRPWRDGARHAHHVAEGRRCSTAGSGLRADHFRQLGDNDGNTYGQARLRHAVHGEYRVARPWPIPSTERPARSVGKFPGDSRRQGVSANQLTIDSVSKRDGGRCADSDCRGDTAAPRRLREAMLEGAGQKIVFTPENIELPARRDLRD